MRTGIELLEDAEFRLGEACGCANCDQCDLHAEIAAYLDKAQPERVASRNAQEQAVRDQARRQITEGESHGL